MLEKDRFAKFPEEVPTRDRIEELLRTISDKSIDLTKRDDAKNELLLAQARFIWSKVFQLTGGRIGIDDRQTELFDSAFGYLKERASTIAETASTSGLSLLTVVATRLKGWAVDKIRRSDGQSLARGKGMEKQSAEVIEWSEGTEEMSVETVMHEETLAQIKTAVFGAVAQLTDVEQAVVVSYFGLGRAEMTMRDIAQSLNISLREAQNARRRAEYKLKQWLKGQAP